MHYDREALHNVRETRLLIDAYDAWLFSELESYLGDRIIEIGCGLGNLLTHLVDRDLAVGIDNSSRTIEEASQKFSAFPNVKLQEFSITDPAVMELRKFDFDSAVSLNVLEHIADDEVAMQHVYGLLRPSSNFVLIVPAHEWLLGTMDRSIGHYRRYSKDVASEKLGRVGFSVVKQKYINSVGAIGWFVNAKMLRRKVPPSGQLRLFNRLVPFIRRFESMVQLPFGISLLTVARK